ncbi:MAG: hypothetical protein ABUS79_02430 [Pseudomonadota bacterium]
MKPDDEQDGGLVTSSEPSAEAETAADWRGDDWESARRRKLTLGLAATPDQRLAWLEEAMALAWASGALPRPRE